MVVATRRVLPWLIALTAALALIRPAFAAAPQVDASSYLLQSPATGETLASRDGRRPVPIASITKLMTALVTLEHARLDDVVTVRPEAAAVGESTIHLHAGERLTVRDLVKAALIQSANDAADALAAYVGHGDIGRFVAFMNAKARKLHLRDTHFTRPDGLDALGHVSSARDVTRLAQVAMRSARLRAIVRERSDTIAGNRRLYTWNDLLDRFRGVIGVKTGHTAAAGWCEVAAARRGPVTIYATILGSPSREQRNRDLAALLQYGLAQLTPVTLTRRGSTYARVELPYGRAPVRLVAARSLVRVVRVGRPLVERVAARRAIPLPVERGQAFGSLRIYRGERLIAKTRLVAARSVDRPGLASRIRWYAGRTAHHLAGLVAVTQAPAAAAALLPLAFTLGLYRRRRGEP